MTVRAHDRMVRRQRQAPGANQYDKQSRVTAQTDANGGRYKIQYEDGYTVTTDAEGNVVTYYYDEWKRTTRIVDAWAARPRSPMDSRVKSCP